MAEPTYRRAVRDDARAIAAVITELVQQPLPVDFDASWSEETVHAWMERLGEHGCIYLAEQRGETAGFGTLDPSAEDAHAATLGVWLRSPYRRQGIGTRLAEHLLEHARAQGFQRIVGRLPRDNAAALSFLSAIGALVSLFNPEMRFELPL